MDQTERIDRWLWTVRLFKTRSRATLACKAGKIRIKDQPVKPSREIHPGDHLTLHLPPAIKTIRVIALPVNRVSAKQVVDFMEDLTPDDEIRKLRLMKETNYEYREKGLGRPTKRQRREIELLKKIWKE